MRKRYYRVPTRYDNIIHVCVLTESDATRSVPYHGENSVKHASVCTDAESLWIREINPQNFVLFLPLLLKLNLKFQSNGMPLHLHSDTSCR